VRYNIFRGTAPDFIPSAANRIAACAAGPSSVLDTDNLQSGTTFYYVVRAEDTTTGNGGTCGGGNEESNEVRVAATPYAAGLQAAPGTFVDGGGDHTSFLRLNVAGDGDTGYPPWRYVTTAIDPGANHTPGGGYAYRNAGPSAGNTYGPAICGEMQSPLLTAAATTVNLLYWERHQLDYRKDAVAVEYSVNGGDWTDAPPPSNSPAAGCDASDDTSGWEPLSCTPNGAGSACGYHDPKTALSGPLASGTACGDFATSENVTPYAHRCQQIADLTPNDTIQFRWRFSSDGAGGYAGFYLDDIEVTDVRVPNVCTPDTCTGQPDGTACSDGDPCTVGDACGGGVCAGGASSAPGETQSVGAAADKVTYTWSAVPLATRYDVVRGSLGSLPVGPSGGDEVCFDDLAGPSLIDTTVPSAGAGFWYLSRAENACNGTFGRRSNGAPRVTTTCP